MYKVYRKVLMLTIFFTLISNNSNTSVSSKERVAVLRFENSSTKKGDMEQIGIGLSDMLITTLVQTGKYEVIEREQLEKVLKEQKLGLSGFVDLDTAKKVGKILGLDALFIGKLTKYQEEVKQDIWTGYTSYIVRVAIDVRMIDVETGKIILAEAAEGQNKKKALIYTDPYTGYTRIIEGTVGIDESMFSDAAREAINKTGEKISKAIPIEGLVAKVEGQEVTINLGSRSGIKEGMELKVYHKGEEIKDPATGEVLEVEKEEIAKIKITKVSEKISKGKVKGKPKKDINVGDIVSNK